MMSRAFLIIAFTAGTIFGYSVGKPSNKQNTNLHSVDKKHYEQFEIQSHYNDSVLSNIGSGNIRLYVNKADSGSTASMDDGKRIKCELHRSDAQRVIEITRRADQCSARLTALQDWVDSHF